MKVTGVQHVALVVTDVDRAVRFYTDVLGCEVVAERPDFGLPGAWLRAGDQQVHLALAPRRRPTPSSTSRSRSTTSRARSTRSGRAGWKIDPVPLTPGAGHQAFLRDPSGNLIELNQPE